MDIDSTALANGLSDIAAMVNVSESDPRKMRELIWEIRDRAELAMSEYQQAESAARDQELAELRARVGQIS